MGGRGLGAPLLGAPLLGIVLAVTLAGCSDDRRPSGSAVEPVQLTLPAPTYAAATAEGLVVRVGTREEVLPQATQSWFLPDGTALLRLASGNRAGRLRLYDPARGLVGDEVAMERYDDPGRTVARLVLLGPLQGSGRLHRYSLPLRRRGVLDLPGPAPDAPSGPHPGEHERHYLGPALSIGAATFVRWGDSVGDHDDVPTDDGILRISSGPDGEPVFEDVLVNERVVELHLAADGSALLGVRQSSGEPCGGCVVDQDVVEIDPATGELTDLGHPDEYDDSWRVVALDKVGDRVAVRYWGPPDGRRGYSLIGTYVHDDSDGPGDWTLLEGSDEVVTWWQDGGRVLARPNPAEDLRSNTGARDGYRLSWLADGASAEQPLAGELIGSLGGRYRVGEVPGQLLPSD